MLWLCVWEEEIFMDLCEQPVVSAIPIQVHSISIGAKKKGIPWGTWVAQL